MRRLGASLFLAASAGCAPTQVALPTAEEARLTQPPQLFGQTWTYSVRGDFTVSPLAISDDGMRTEILYGANQALPAVFAIGPTGEEMAINGNMRGDTYVIDQVFDRLVFRIDKARAVATRSQEPRSEDPA